MEDESMHIVMEYAEKGDLYRVSHEILELIDNNSFWKINEQEGNTFQKKIYGIFLTKYVLL